MVLEQTFTTTQQVIASYNYVDIADGTGVQVMYGATHKELTTETYFLASLATLSKSITTDFVVTADTVTKVIDVDFDLAPFNIPRTILGTARIMFTMGGRSGTGSGQNNMYTVVKFRKWDGTTETEIASVTSETVDPSYSEPTGEVKSFPQNMEVEISRTVFAVGEILRVTMEIWAVKTGTRIANIGFGHDPKDRDDPGSGGNPSAGATQVVKDSDSTVLEIHVPFALEI